MGGYPLQDGGGRLVSVLRLPRVGRLFKCITPCKRVPRPVIIFFISYFLNWAPQPTIDRPKNNS